MKKSLFVAAIAAVALVACKKTETVETANAADSAANAAVDSALCLLALLFRQHYCAYYGYVRCVFRRRIRPRRATSIAWFNARFLLLPDDVAHALWHGYCAYYLWFGLCHVGGVVENGAGDECGQPDHLGCDRRLLVALVGILVVNTAGGGLLPP